MIEAPAGSGMAPAPRLISLHRFDGDAEVRAAAALAWASAEWISRGKPSVLGIASGAVAGLVAITPASGFVGPTPAVVIGIIAGSYASLQQPP